MCCNIVYILLFSDCHLALVVILSHVLKFLRYVFVCDYDFYIFFQYFPTTTYWKSGQCWRNTTSPPKKNLKALDIRVVSFINPTFHLYIGDWDLITHIWTQQSPHKCEIPHLITWSTTYQDKLDSDTTCWGSQWKVKATMRPILHRKGDITYPPKTLMQQVYEYSLINPTFTHS